MGAGSFGSPERQVVGRPSPEVVFAGTPETEERALVALWDVVLREKAKRHNNAAQPARGPTDRELPGQKG